MLSAVSFVSSSAASSKSSRSTCGEFWHAMPLHWPHAGVHWRPFLKQVQDRVSHLPPQLHLIFRRSCAGAAGSDICTGIRPVEDLAHPHSSGERSFPFHACTCRKTRWLWNRAASYVGGSFSGGTYPAAVATFVWNFWSLAVFRSCAWLPYMISSALSPAFSRATFEDSLAIKVAALSSRAAYFFRTPTFPIPCGLEVVSQPLIAWRKRSDSDSWTSTLRLMVVAQTVLLAATIYTLLAAGSAWWTNNWKTSESSATTATGLVMVCARTVWQIL